METQQTQIRYLDGGIVLTESCTEGEAIVAAETEEFYGQYKGRAKTASPQFNEGTHKEVSSNMSSSGGNDLPVDTLNNNDNDNSGQQETEEPLDTVQTVTENEDLILENVQNFINMAYLQQVYLQQTDYQQLPKTEPVQIDLEPGKRLLLLDMDETMIHAATTVDIEINQVYGPDAQPDFYTSFQDEDSEIRIGVFKRPYLEELLERALPFFQICVYTASEKLYADAILDVLDPNHTIFYKRIYRDQCLKAFIPSPSSNNAMQDLIPN